MPDPYVLTMEGETVTSPISRNGRATTEPPLTATSPVAVMRRYMDSLPPDMSMKEEVRTSQLWKAVRTEFLATVLLTIFGCGSCWVHKVPPTDLSVGLEIKVSLAFGVTVATLVQCLGPVSGGHMNPAVTLSLAVTRHISALRAGLYVVAQCLGGLVGAVILYGLTPEDSRVSAGLGATEPSDNLHLSQVFGLEFLGTLMVVLTVQANVDPMRTDLGFRALSIGLAYTAAHLFTFRYTGASLNPARSLGPAVVTNSWKCHWVYWIGPLMAGFIGGFTYEYSRDSSSASSLRRSFRRKNPFHRGGTGEMIRDNSGGVSSNETEMTAASNDYGV